MLYNSLECTIRKIVVGTGLADSYIDEFSSSSSTSESTTSSMSSSSQSTTSSSSSFGISSSSSAIPTQYIVSGDPNPDVTGTYDYAGLDGNGNPYWENSITLAVVTYSIGDLDWMVDDLVGNTWSSGLGWGDGYPPEGSYPADFGASGTSILTAVW